jgi:ceramide glucosyltransferase
VLRDFIFGSLALLSLGLWLWQWFVARRFPLHQRVASHTFPPAVTLLKPLKGAEAATHDCLRSWFAQDYTGRVQILFAVAEQADPVCEIVRALQQEFKNADASLIVCGPLQGTNAKVSKLMQIEPLAKHDWLIISDADVLVPADFLTNCLETFRSSEPVGSAKSCGLLNCFYRLANPTTLAMQWEAICINADFWSQVLQARSLKDIDFALGAVMVTDKNRLKSVGGFTALANHLADDYELGHRIARLGNRIELSTLVVDCFASPMDWRKAWTHQLRWARTIRVCQPVPYFFSILSNPTLWPVAWFLAHPGIFSGGFLVGSGILRVIGALDLQQRLTRSKKHFAYWWLIPLKDLLQALLWLLAFVGNRIEWRGQRLQLRRDGTLEKIE